MTYFHIKGVNREYGVLGYQICFVDDENLRKQALSKNLNAVHSRKESKFKIYETVNVSVI